MKLIRLTEVQESGRTVMTWINPEAVTYLRPVDAILSNTAVGLGLRELEVVETTLEIINLGLAIEKQEPLTQEELDAPGIGTRT